MVIPDVLYPMPGWPCRRSSRPAECIGIHLRCVAPEITPDRVELKLATSSRGVLNILLVMNRLITEAAMIINGSKEKSSRYVEPQRPSSSTVSTHLPDRDPRRLDENQ